MTTPIECECGADLELVICQDCRGRGEKNRKACPNCGGEKGWWQCTDYARHLQWLRRQHEAEVRP